MPPSSTSVEVFKQKTIANETKIDVHDKHLDRIDIMLEKMTETSVALKEIVKSHENQLDERKAEDAKILEMMELRRLHNDEIINGIKQEISDIKDEMHSFITEIKATIHEMKISFSDKISESKSFFDKYKYMIFGGGVVVVYLFDKLHVIEHLFHIPVAQAVVG